MSLRMRLLIAISGFVMAGLIAAGAVTYVLIRNYLLARVDERLRGAQLAMFHQLQDASASFEPVPGATDLMPVGTVGEIVRGADVVAGPVFAYGKRVGPPPSIPALSNLEEPRIFTTGAIGRSSFRYRALAQGLVPSGAVFVVAIPLTEVGQTLHRLLGVELAVTVSVLLGLGGLSWWIVRRELRPLERIEETAGAIAAGDLSQRVGFTDPRTEIGRLGVSLNTMLGRIEQAFAERTRSEDRLRRFLADASHELRTPLTSIRGYAELFRRGANDRPEDLATSMRRIEEESARMGVLVDDLLLLARLDQGRALERDRVDLVRIATDAVDDARAVDPGRAITLDAPISLDVVGDEARLREVAANLLSNALAHTPPGTPVEVAVRMDGSEASLEVTDHGPGIAEAEQRTIFEPFARSDPSRGRSAGGTGLGLAIVSAIVAAHGGTMEVRSSPEAGATFSARIPRGEGPALPDPPASGRRA